MTRAETIRAVLEVADFATAQPALRRVLRRAARARVYRYALRHQIVDFADNALVEQAHRDFRQAVIDAALLRLGEIDAATDVPGLLLVFDAFSDWV